MQKQLVQTKLAAENDTESQSGVLFGDGWKCFPLTTAMLITENLPASEPIQPALLSREDRRHIRQAASSTRARLQRSLRRFFWHSQSGYAGAHSWHVEGACVIFRNAHQCRSQYQIVDAACAIFCNAHQCRSQYQNSRCVTKPVADVLGASCPYVAQP